MPFYEKSNVCIHYEEVGSGFPLLVIPGGGLNSTVAGLANHPFNPMEEFKGGYRVIAADLRNANGGQSSGPLETDRPWDAYTDDHIGLMDHLGIREFMVLGFCIGGPFIWNLLKRAPERVVAGVLTQPSGFRPTMPDLFYQNNIKGWAPALCEHRSDITMAQAGALAGRCRCGAVRAGSAPGSPSTDRCLPARLARDARFQWPRHKDAPGRRRAGSGSACGNCAQNRGSP